MKITVQPYSQMRYKTCGDYVLERGKWHFYIARLSKRRYEWLIALHEIIECYLCQWAGIREGDITVFDMEYEDNRLPGDLSEPGNSEWAPYRRQHQIATFFERLAARTLLINWKSYEQEINSLV